MPKKQTPLRPYFKKMPDIGKPLSEGEVRRSKENIDLIGEQEEIIAAEIAELASAVETGTPVEVDIAVGEAAVALVLAVHESSEIRQAVSVDDVRNGRVSDYQDVTDQKLGLIE